MAKHKSHASRSLARWTPPRAAKPIVIRTTVIKKAKHTRRGGRRSGSLTAGLMSSTRMGVVAGAFAVGFLEKQGLMSNLPALPFIGRTGTIGLAAYLLSNHGHNKLADEICTAAFVIAAHELASTGTIVGAEAPQDAVGYVAGW